MNNIVPIFKDTVQEVLDEISAEAPETILTFTRKKGEIFIRSSNLDGITEIIGALERIKYELLGK